MAADRSAATSYRRAFWRWLLDWRGWLVSFIYVGTFYGCWFLIGWWAILPGIGSYFISRRVLRSSL